VQDRRAERSESDGDEGGVGNNSSGHDGTRTRDLHRVMVAL
jgi:hypothetical protein